MQRGGQRYTLGWDQVGSLRAVIDAQGQVVKEIEYDAFGNILRETAPELRVPFGFAGGLHDRDTGLIRYRFRDYLPDMGRFTAKDPIGYKGGDSDLYGYCLDDPVNGIDPSGLKKLSLLTSTYSTELPFNQRITFPWDTHSALQICNDDETGCEIWDNAGSYSEAMNCGSSQLCREEEGSLDRYLDYRHQQGDDVSITRIPASDAQIDQVQNGISNIGYVEPLQCATAVGQVLREAGILDENEKSIRPRKLENIVRSSIGYKDTGGGGGW